MVASVGIPSDLTASDRATIFGFLDAYLNSEILHALLYGIYTGILAVTLWNIFINKRWPIRRAMVVVIILLYALITIGFAVIWSYIRSAFIENGQSFWTVYLKLNGAALITCWGAGIATSLSTILADLHMIWCCWMVWRRCWLVVLPPILSLVFAIVSKYMEVYHQYLKSSVGVFPILYISSVLAATLWCTLFIFYRILTVAGFRHRDETRLRVYRRFIEVLVESSALYSISLILYLAFTIRSNLGLYYLDVIAGIVKGIAPTLLVGRITAGHRARPDDSWQGSVIASASIRSQSQDRNRTSFQEDPTSPILDDDLEAQREISLREASPALRSVCVAADHGRPSSNTNVSPENVTSSPHLGNRSLFHDRYNQTSEVVARGSTIVDETAVSESVTMQP